MGHSEGNLLHLVSPPLAPHPTHTHTHTRAFLLYQAARQSASHPARLSPSINYSRAVDIKGGISRSPSPPHCACVERCSPRVLQQITSFLWILVRQKPTLSNQFLIFSKKNTKPIVAFWKMVRKYRIFSKIISKIGIWFVWMKHILH